MCKRMNIKVCNNGRSHIRLVQSEFISMSSLRRNSVLKMLQHRDLERAPSSLGLVEKWIKRCPTLSKLEMLDLCWINVDEGIQRLRETGMLEWIRLLGPTYSH